MPFMNTTPAQMLNEIKSTTGLGEIALAEKLGISQPTVNRILNGQPDCKGKTLQSIAALYQQVIVSRVPA
jgi:plasmid maintenance system antidote protein VapI